MGYKSMQDTFVFKSLSDGFSSTIRDSIVKGKVLTQRELEEQFLMIKKYKNSVLKPKIMSELNEGGIKLIYVPEGVNRTVMLPFIMTMNGNKMCANIMVSSYGNMRQDGMVNMDYGKLYAIMESAYLAKKFLENYDKYRNDNVLSQQGAILYANMFVKPLNKRFNIHVDRERENKILFLASKFYLKNVLGLRNDELIFNISMKACKAGNPLVLKEVDMMIEEESFKDLGTFIEALQNPNLNLGLVGLNTRGYINLFVGMYGEATLFALELMPYFLFVGNASLNAMGLVNNYSLEDIMEKGMAKILSRFYI